MTLEAIIFIALGLALVAFGIKTVMEKSAANKKDVPPPKLTLRAALPDESESKLNKFISQGRHLEGVKWVRENTNLDLHDSKVLYDWFKDGKPLQEIIVIEPIQGVGHASSKGENTHDFSIPHEPDMGSTAEFTALSDTDAIQMAQILVNKGLVIEAVKVLRENAGYDMKKATDVVNSMGKKVHPAD